MTSQSYNQGSCIEKERPSMGRASSSHQIYAAVNNRLGRTSIHGDRVIKYMLNHINIKILFDSGGTNSFISLSTLEKSGLAAYKHNDFKQVEIASGRKTSSMT
jgi:hypothetical protein